MTIIKRGRGGELIGLCLYNLIAFVLAWKLEVIYIVSIVLFFFPPIVYLAFKAPSKALKALIFSAILVFPAVTITDYVAVSSLAWIVPQTVFPLRIISLPIEDYLIVFSLIMYCVLFYEYFVDRGVDRRLYKQKIRPLILFWFGLLALFGVVYFYDKGAFDIPYAYLILGLLTAVVPIVGILRHPVLLPKVVVTALYFAFVLFLFELPGVWYSQWVFPGDYIGYLKLFNAEFPFEEFFVWIIASSVTIVWLYEFFDDDGK